MAMPGSAISFMIGNGHRGVMSFPLGTIPGDATVLSASLDIWTQGAIADVTKPIGQMELRRLLGTPVEGTGVGSSSTDGQGTGVSWNSRTGTINWTTAGGDFDSSATPGLLATLPGYAPNAAGIQSTFASIGQLRVRRAGGGDRQPAARTDAHLARHGIRPLCPLPLG